MIYQTGTDRIEAFATRQWVDTPAQMLRPIIMAQLRGGDGLLYVTEASSGMAVSDMILDTQIVALEQDFTVTPSQARFKLTANLTESKTGRPWASRDFEGSVTVAGDGSEASVAAANQVVALVLRQLGGFCESELARWQTQHKP
jgi:cholesterol transport system auxiliary component